jgi:hypothetical protein
MLFPDYHVVAITIVQRFSDCHFSISNMHLLMILFSFYIFLWYVGLFLFIEENIHLGKYLGARLLICLLRLLSFVGNCQAVIQSGCIPLHSDQQWTSSYSYISFFFNHSLVVQWHLTLIWNFLKTYGIEYIFICKLVLHHLVKCSDLLITF